MLKLAKIGRHRTRTLPLRGRIAAGQFDDDEKALKGFCIKARARFKLDEN